MKESQIDPPFPYPGKSTLKKPSLISINECNNAYHSTIKMKLVDVVEQSTYIAFRKEINKKDLKLKVGHNVRISSYKNNFSKGYAVNWSEEVFLIKRVNNTVPWTYVISHTRMRKLSKRLKNNNCKRKIKQSLGLKKHLREKMINYMTNGKVMITHLIVVLIKEISVYKMTYFPEPHTRSRDKMETKLDLNQICLIMQQNPT